MKGTDYMGDREFLFALSIIGREIEKLNLSNEKISFKTDSSYTGQDGKIILSKIEISAYQSSFKNVLLYRVNMTVKLPHVEVNSSLFLGNDSELKIWLKKLSSLETVKLFLFDFYKGLYFTSRYEF